MIENGIIQIDSDKAKPFKFTSDKYDRASYLWKKDNDIIISFIDTVDHGKGYLTELFNNISSKGFNILVPTPSNKMRGILEKKGFIGQWQDDENFGLVEVFKLTQSNERSGNAG